MRRTWSSTRRATQAFPDRPSTARFANDVLM